MLSVSCTTADGDKRPSLAVTIEPYRFIVEAVAGNGWQVHSVVPSGASPETFDPSPAHIMRLSGSKVYFLVGGIGFEKRWCEKIAEVCPSLILSDTSEGITRDEDDPHLWTSPGNCIVIAENVCRELCRIDSANSTHYKERLRGLVEVFASTDSLIAAKLDSCENRAFMIFHPSLTYFSKRYNLKQVVIEEHGKEPSAAHLKEIIDEARLLGVRKILLQSEFDKRHAESIAEEIGAEIITINPLSYDWREEMLRTAENIKTDLPE